MKSDANVDWPYALDVKLFLTFMQNYKFDKLPEEADVLKDEIFYPFYQHIIHIFLQYKGIKRDKFLQVVNCRENAYKYFYQSIRDVPLQVCIKELQECKKNNRLSGNNPEEEYEYYCVSMLGDRQYVTNLCREYGEMTRIILTRLQFAWENGGNIWKRLSKDKKQIEQMLCEGKHFEKILSLNFVGKNSYTGGKQALCLTLDNGVTIIYKPYSLDKEVIYQNTYQWFGKKLGIRTYNTYKYKIIDKKDYGWTEYLQCRLTKEDAGLQRYYRRVGIHLFLCYLLQVTDIQRENIIAADEFPVIVSIKTIPGIKEKIDLETAEAVIRDQMNGAVLGTGILPIPMWHNDEINAHEKIMLPVIRAAKTSNMYIDYEDSRHHFGKSLPACHGNPAQMKEYMKEVCIGFTMAYRLLQREGEHVEEKISPFWDCRIQYMLKSTQQYHMYLAYSLRPEAMRNTEARFLMLQQMEADNGLEIEEIKAIMQLDIPIFMCNGREVVPAFQESPYGTYMRKTKKVGNRDLRRQLRMIHLSMEMAEFEKTQDHYYETLPMSEEIRDVDEDAIERALYLLHNRVEEEAVICGNDIGWMTLHLEAENSWHMETVDFDFYNGLGGIVTYVALMLRQGLLEKTEIFPVLLRKMCAYVDQGCRDKQKRTGILIGDGSVIYSFYLLYHILGEKYLLEYADKHVAALRENYRYDQKYNIISGNAGAVIMLMKLYSVMKKQDYLELAKRIADTLWDKDEVHKSASGMAYGNSGFILAYASLLEYTHEARYKDMIDELLAGEDTLYSEESGNWKSTCIWEKDRAENSWCHGAAGIMLARLKLYQLEEYHDNKTVMKDIQNAAKILFTSSKRKGLSICHGMAGNYCAMREYRNVFSLNDEQKHYMRHIRNTIVNTVLDSELMPQDNYMMGFMTGLTGIGWFLLHMLEDDKLGNS